MSATATVSEMLHTANERSPAKLVSIAQDIVDGSPLTRDAIVKLIGGWSLDELAAEVSHLESIAGYEKDIADQQAILQTENAKQQPVHDAIAKIKAQMAPLEARLAELQGQLGAYNFDRDMACRALADAQRALRTARNDLIGHRTRRDRNRVA